MKKQKAGIVPTQGSRAVRYVDLEGKLLEFPDLASLIKYLEPYRSAKRLDKNVSAKVPSRMKSELEWLKKRTGASYASVVRLGLAVALKEVRK